MKKILPLTFFIGFLISCKKDEKIIIVPDTSVTSFIIDTMKVASGFQTSNPGFYNQFHDKTYYDVETKITTFYKVNNQDIYITFDDTSAIKGNSFIIKFANKSLSTISGTYDLASNNTIQYNQNQRFYGGFISSFYTHDFLKGTLQITYDAERKALSGYLSNAEQRIDVYVPYQYANTPYTQTLGEVSLLGNTSKRIRNLSFEYVKSL
jgi:hypothetical protein